ncbi:MAG: DUF4287 domain-containing protein [Verrucomicrobiae bacterium]|nr:DUF4287 domain-containing protein [Verrucomicrobiae bacterium]
MKTTLKPITSDQAIQKRTGKTWPQWFQLLDNANAHQLDHKKIVALLKKEFSHLNGWWQQMITVTYEQARDLRKKYQTSKGYQISVSKTYPLAPSKLYQIWQDKNRKTWLPHPFTIRKATRNKTLRITWEQDQTHLDVQLYSKNKNKTQLTVQHRKLKTAASANRMKKFWSHNLKQLAKALETSKINKTD